jgi:hypothetical protein
MNIDENENKKIELAFEILEIDVNVVNVESITKDYLKKKYHKLCLKWHPDKNTQNIQESTEKFREINDSYVYLLKQIFDENSNTFDDKSISDNFLYQSILIKFLKLIITGEYSLNFFQEIILNINILSISIFENIDVRTAIDLYNLLCKYREIFHISNEALLYVSLLIKEKYKNDKIIILRSTIDDLWQNNIYKLNYEDECYLVPLWHNELYFEKNNIIILCHPSLPEDIKLDENNNIIVNVKISIKEELSQLLLNDNYKIVSIGYKNFSIPLDKLFMRKYQIYEFKGQGISRIVENDIYNTKIKSKFIIKIYII